MRGRGRGRGRRKQREEQRSRSAHAAGEAGVPVVSRERSRDRRINVVGRPSPRAFPTIHTMHPAPLLYISPTGTHDETVNIASRRRGPRAGIGRPTPKAQADHCSIHRYVYVITSSIVVRRLQAFTAPNLAPTRAPSRDQPAPSHHRCPSHRATSNPSGEQT